MLSQGCSYNVINLKGIQTIQTLQNKTTRSVHRYLLFILLANAFDIETNPGPRARTPIDGPAVVAVRL